MQNGEAHYTIKAIKATTGIRYRTSGWIVSSEDWDGNAYHHQHGIIDSVEITKTKTVGPYVYTTFKLSQEQISKAMIDAGMGEWKSGEIIYLSAIMEVFVVPESVEAEEGAKYKLEGGKLTEVEGN